MDSRGLQLMRLIITQSWRLFTEWKLPVVNFTPASLLFFITLFPMIVALLKSILTLTLDSMVNFKPSNGDTGINHVFSRSNGGKWDSFHGRYM